MTVIYNILDIKYQFTADKTIFFLLFYRLLLCIPFKILLWRVCFYAISTLCQVWEMGKLEKNSHWIFATKLANWWGWVRRRTFIWRMNHVLFRNSSSVFLWILSGNHYKIWYPRLTDLEAKIRSGQLHCFLGKCNSSRFAKKTYCCDWIFVLMS